MSTNLNDQVQIERDAGEIVDGKVFDQDGNHVPARLRVWGPTVVDGEQCVIGEPIEFEMSEPNENYDGNHRAIVAADDLQIAFPLRLIHGDDRGEEGPGGPAMVGGLVRLPADEEYHWITPAEAGRLRPALRWSSGSGRTEGRPRRRCES